MQCVECGDETNCDYHLCSECDGAIDEAFNQGEEKLN